MRVDAYFAIRFKEVPTETQIKHLRFHLLHRFRDILWWKDGDTFHTLINPVTADCTSLPIDRLYDITTMIRYYGPGYERGPGLKIAGLLLYLHTRDDIETVYYGGDGIKEFSKKDAEDLLSHYLSVGRLPYLNWGEYRSYWFKEYNKNKTYDSPLCDWCDYPMIDYGGGAGKTFWTCPGCNQDKVTPES